jgi:hypothetical protein
MFKKISKLAILFLTVCISSQPAHSKKPKYKCEEEAVVCVRGSEACGFNEEQVDTIFHLYKDGEEIGTFKYNDGNGIDSIGDCKNYIKQLKAGR